mgnify:CR=1 FL=1
MKVFAHNFNPNSNSGPNKFTRSLFEALKNKKGFSLCSQAESDVEFCLIQQSTNKKKPMLLRLDGIYFNSEQDFNQKNAPIRFAYENADAVVFQSNFNKQLTERWFGEHRNSHVIHNAYFGETVKDSIFQKAFPGKEIWSCASAWRPHKRLLENIKYYIKHGPENSVFVVAGDTTSTSTGITENETYQISQLSVPESKAVIFFGNLEYSVLRQLYDASTTFIHLAYLDHCPNVVVDAHAHGCKIVCASSGGTKEVSWSSRKDRPWDFSPIPLYNPPKLNLEDIIENHISNTPTIKRLAAECLNKYEKVLKEIKNER